MGCILGFALLTLRLDVTKILLLHDQNKVHEYSKKGLDEIFSGGSVAPSDRNR